MHFGFEFECLNTETNKYSNKLNFKLTDMNFPQQKNDTLLKEYFQVSSQIFASQSKTDLDQIRKKLSDIKDSIKQKNN